VYEIIDELHNALAGAVWTEQIEMSKVRSIEVKIDDEHSATSQHQIDGHIDECRGPTHATAI
jgi:hypothetical protein